MRLAIFTNTYLPHTGGVARSVESLRRGLEARGHRCLVVAPEYTGQDTTDPWVVRVPAIRNFNGSGFSLRLPLPAGVGERIRRFRPDLVHSHHPFLLGDSALRMAYQWDRPLVYTHHTRYEQYTHYVLRESVWLRRFVAELVPAYERCCDRVIVPGESLAQGIRDSGVAVPLEVIPTGIDLVAFRGGRRWRGRERLGIPARAKVIGHLGRLEPEKHLPFLLSAVRECLRRDNGGHFLLVGEGSERDQSRDLMKAAIGRRRFHAVGIVQEKALPDIYAAMDVFVFSSLSETQGIVLAEALASGVPVVALRATGVSDIVRNGINGRLLDPDCGTAAFAEAIEEVLSWRQEQKRLGEILRASVVGYSREGCLSRMEALYASLIATRGIRDASKWNRLMNRLEGERNLAMAHGHAFLQAFGFQQRSAGGPQLPGLNVP